ncbi:MAG: 5-(carboxyamino)imidazole ribonucleotide mutase [Thermoplasmata archaeon]|jgi:5-(carboxyamino)imidazole ribonucleotide mutase|nr:5-(carboxyamino)imidazole ribonucleotide mutase [Thermoplasmata archaeon]MVT12991.1 5-(carboxyamino)imidazole ribonucleotide mutase [Euryarchaeota archaeon]MVT14953.1 5-(carboxyamino)imidazole ribonucleotide mutase [Euryarchaeota archaeon]MVT35191.1 5-(carboxyamino)imidazole ribonucleotide mutase [Euryarchaeota archaeon]
MDVQIFAGSSSDREIVKDAVAVLKDLGINYSVKIISAHRHPELLMEYVRKSDAKVFIAIAGLSAALPGFIASITRRPVIGVPVSGKVPFDSILSMVQLPKGVPVAVVGVDNAKNAALLAARILAISDNNIDKNLERYIENEKRKSIEEGKKVEEELI